MIEIYAYLKKTNPFYMIFDGRVPVLDLVPIKAQVADLGQVLVYRVDVKRLTGKQLWDLCQKIGELQEAHVPHVEPLTVYDEIRTVGLPIRATEVTATSLVKRYARQQ